MIQFDSELHPEIYKRGTGLLEAILPPRKATCFSGGITRTTICLGQSLTREAPAGSQALHWGSNPLIAPTLMKALEVVILLLSDK